MRFLIYSGFTMDHCKFTMTHCKCTVTLFRVQGYKVFKFYPLSLRYRDPAASPLNARQYMFENRAIKLINRQLS